MKRLILLLILLSIVIATPVSAEEIRLTTIVPDQTILRTKKGAIGDTYSNPAPPPTGVPNDSIPTSGLLVEGNVGIGTGTTSLTEKLTVSGNTKISGYMFLPPTSQPAPPQPGMIYYDTSTNVMRYYKGGASPQWVDLSGGSGGAFGQWYGGAVRNTVYRASTDGIVVASAANCTVISGYTDYNASNPLMLVARANNPQGIGTKLCITFPVKKGDNWEVDIIPSSSTGQSILWLPVGE